MMVLRMNPRKERSESTCNPLDPILALRKRGASSRGSALPTVLAIAALLVAGVVLTGVLSRNPNQANAPAPEVAASMDQSNTASLDAATPPTEELSDDAKVDRAAELVVEGTELLNDQQYNEAIKLFRQALALHSDDETTHYNLGYALARAGRADEAIAAYREALRILPEYPEALNNMGNLLSKQGKFAEAVEALQKVIEISPDHFSAHNNLGTTLSRMGKINEATIHFAKAAQINPQYIEAQFNLGNAYLELGRTDEAIAQFDKVLQLRPGFPPVMNALARAREKKLISSGR